MVALAGGVTTTGSGRWLMSTTFTSEFGGPMSENEESDTEKCCNGSTTNSERSGVEMMVFAVDTAKQCFKVSSLHIVSYRLSIWSSKYLED